ncbi:putative short-chain oxidoreductase [Roridomyces roridus]|uniref:Short-chain oxidoreductase n=1 Tax=Roridomyces roridus TaxID=1738132 RepID=A0AAD7FVF9_9AGAR|nr:putative short-chain oxidoreductase [Roridomyces roridus]
MTWWIKECRDADCVTLFVSLHHTNRATMDTHQPVVLITGCSTGLGRELSLAALSSGFRVIATARRPETLKSLEEAGAKTLKLDVTSTCQDLAVFAAEAIALYGQVDVLINNAGYLQGGAVEENTDKENRAQFDTNFFGVINVTNAFLPHFRSRKSGTIVNISSQGSLLGLAGAGIYCASKAALEAISDTWARELAPFNIRSTSILLGAFRTAVAESTNLKITAKRIDGYDAGHDWVAAFNSTAGKERGDTKIAARKIRRKALPMRIAIGEDALEYLREFHARALESAEKWREVSTGTDVV